ncbi:MAG: Niacin transporter NiaP [Rhodanobacteraceae bacterium]|jgi:putative MFS transporter|nr:MAG: Niacin transporter NiaP [Rhodanobacteraceae bacterium]
MRITFHHPVAFWFGCLTVAAGVCLHLPMYVMAAPMHFHLAGMPMDGEMLLGMLLIPSGVLLAAWGLLPRLAQVRMTTRGGARLHWHVADGVPLNVEHWKLVAVLALALTIDVMKPASIAFVMPGMAHEYAIGMSKAGYLALSALIGTAVGSVVWGRLADVFGRRAAILLSALLFMGTAICGTMPSFNWNLVMCFMMGAAAGGMLPIAFTLMAETVPARHRGWLLVALGGVGTSAGYLAASGAAALLEPSFSWRALWLLNLPTGALIVVLNRYIPESPRFLANAGLEDQARGVLARFAGSSHALVNDAESAAAPIMEIHQPRAGLREMLRGRHARITLALMACGLAWGLVNFGFVLWLPANLQKLGLDAGAAGKLMAQSALLAIPGIAVVVWLYQRWSSFRTLVLFVALTVLALLAFALIELFGLRAQSLTIAATVLLLVAISGVIATMIPYAAEIYPVHLRGTGSGLIAAGSKAGGILGAVLGVAGLFDSFVWSALVIAVPMSIAGTMLWRGGVETSGRELESIQQRLESP